MYITRLELKNVRCFEDLTINFDKPTSSKPASSILILGDNGDVKSTILRSLAMGLCDESSAAALFRELPGEFVRREHAQGETSENPKATIDIELASGSWRYHKSTQITSLETFFLDHAGNPDCPVSGKPRCNFWYRSGVDKGSWKLKRCIVSDEP